MLMLNILSVGNFFKSEHIGDRTMLMLNPSIFLDKV